MRILIFIGGFFPGKKYGGPPVSVSNFCNIMSEDECYVVTKNHDKGDIESYPDIHSGWNDRRNAKVKYLSDEQYNENSFSRIIEDIHPDIIYLQSLFDNSTFACLKLAKANHICVLLAPRGELCAGAFKKKYKKIPFIIMLRIFISMKNIYFQSTSDEETIAIKKYLGAPDDHIISLTNIPSLPEKTYKYHTKRLGEARFVFLSRIAPKKNLISAIKYFSNVSGNITFDIYGPVEDKTYWNHCTEMINKLPKNIHVNYCGLVSHNEVHDVFSGYDAFLFPTFSENFGHVIAEALLSGCRVITSDQTPWTSCEGVLDAIPLHDNDGFVRAIQKIVDSNEDQKSHERCIEYAKNFVQINKVKEEYKRIFDVIQEDYYSNNR